MKNTGVSVFAYNRPSHLRRVLIALEDLKIKKINVFIDGPKDKIDKVCQNEIKFMLKTNKRIKSKIYSNKKNIGLAKSIMNGLSIMSKKYDRFIVLEDDCVPRKEFFKFIYKSLDKYEFNNDIDSVCGYQLPELHQSLSKKIYSFGLKNFVSWGWATWSKKWNSYLKENKKNIKKDLILKSKIFKTIKNKHVDKTKIWTFDYIKYCYINGKYFIFPNKSLVKNIGFDGSGVNSKSSLLFNTKYFPSNKIEIKKKVKLNQKLSQTQEKILSKRLHLFY